MKTIKKLAVAACVGASLISMNNETKMIPEVRAEVVKPSIVLPAGVTQGPTVEGITEYRLANGLRVVLFSDPSKPTATVNMTYLVGSRQENYGETGMAHLLEHLIFKGSKNFPAPTKEFTRRGFRMNGSTWFDRTNYYVSFSSTEDNLKWALAWSADAMRNSFIAKKDLDSEMSVVRNEYEMGENSPTSVMMKRMQSMIFDWHNYGKSTIGNKSDIENVRIENLQDFYHRYYRPDNAVLTVSGKFDIQKTLNWIAEDFGKIENPAETLPPEWTVEPTADGERSFEIRRKGESQLVAVAYRIPSALHADSPAVETAVDILSDDPNGRLYQNLVKTGLATKVFGSVMGTKQPGYVIFMAVVKKGEPIEPVRKALIETIETSLEKTPISSKELDRTKIEAENLYEVLFSDPEAFGVGLSEFIALGDWRLFFYGRDQIQKVTAKEAENAASKYFVRDNRVVGVFLPEDNPKRATIPASPTAEQLLVNYTPKQDSAEAETFDSSFANLDKRTIKFNVGDLKVALLPKKNRGETVTVMLKFDYGNLENLSGKETAMTLANAMLTYGTDKLSRGEIEDEMSKLKMTGSISNYVTTRSNLDASLNFVADLWKHSVYPENEFKDLKKKLTVMFESMKDKPDALSDDAMAQHFNTYPKGDPRHSPSLAEKIAALNALSDADVKAFAKEYFGTARGEIAIVGDFDAKKAEETIKKAFADNKSQVAFGKIYKEFKPVAATRITIDAPEKENAVLAGRAVFPIKDTDADAPALMIANWILGGGTGLSNRLIDRLRQKEGLSYGAGSGVKIPAEGNEGAFVFRAIVAPQNLLKAEASAKDVIETAVRDGFTDQEVAEAKKGFLQSQAVARAQDRVISASWIKKLELNRDWKFNKEMEDKINALTTAQVNAVLKKYIKPDQITYVLAGDLKKTKTEGQK